MYLTIRTRESTLWRSTHPTQTPTRSVADIMAALYDGVEFPTPEDETPEIVRELQELRSQKFFTTHTRNLVEPADEHLKPRWIRGMQQLTEAIQDLHAHNINLDNIAEQYDHFDIPKHSGGYRTISAPKAPLMNFFQTAKTIFEKQFQVLYHNNAYAYFPGRCARDAALSHQENASHWFLKVDLQNFFGSCTFDVIYQQLKKVYPFNKLLTSEHEPLFIEFFKLCLLNGVLPQGTPMSPMLTNLLMIPFDFEFNRAMRLLEYPHIYTRYADDITISARIKFDPQDMTLVIKNMLMIHGYPFQLNEAKTHFGSRAGRNWMLGVMLNKDNNITIGHKKKDRLKAALSSFCQDFTNSNPWSKIDTQKLQGQLSYTQNIEPAYVQNLIQKYEAKFNLPSITSAIRQIIKDEAE